jgi:hypothetical protein
LGVGREANNLTSQNNNCYEISRRPRPTQGCSAEKEEEEEEEEEEYTSETSILKLAPDL